MGDMENKDFLKKKQHPFRNGPDRSLSEYFDELTEQYDASEERIELTKLKVTKRVETIYYIFSLFKAMKIIFDERKPFQLLGDNGKYREQRLPQDKRASFSEWVI